MLTIQLLTLQQKADGAIPTVLIVLMVVVGIALVAFCIAALISIIGSPGLSSGLRLAWVVGVLIFQFFGPVAWFMFGRKAALNGPRP